MIRVESISKSFSGVRALKNVSFEVGAHEVVGFLGPNGAGKTTMMRLLAGFFVPDEGAIELAGVDVLRDPLEAKRRIGYLPEHCPLYPEMRVDEFLKYRAVLKGVLGRRVRDRLQVVKQQCGLESVGRRIIGQLSKGYRQRVGLADALVHEPDVLILDEPTVGLDPQQLRQIRSLIAGLAEDHTILLSTHIMQEVEAVCERVILISSGELVAVDTVDAVRKQASVGGVVQVEVRCDRKWVCEKLEWLGWLELVRVEELPEGWLSLELRLSEGRSAEAVYEWAVAEKLLLRSLHFQASSLEEAFVTLMDGTVG